MQNNWNVMLFLTIFYNTMLFMHCCLPTFDVLLLWCKFFLFWCQLLSLYSRVCVQVCFYKQLRVCWVRQVAQQQLCRLVGQVHLTAVFTNYFDSNLVSILRQLLKETVQCGNLCSFYFLESYVCMGPLTMPFVAFVQDVSSSIALHYIIKLEYMYWVVHIFYYL